MPIPLVAWGVGALIGVFTVKEISNGVQQGKALSHAQKMAEQEAKLARERQEAELKLARESMTHEMNLADKRLEAREEERKALREQILRNRVNEYGAVQDVAGKIGFFDQQAPDDEYKELFAAGSATVDPAIARKAKMAQQKATQRNMDTTFDRPALPSNTEMQIAKSSTEAPPPMTQDLAWV